MSDEGGARLTDAEREFIPGCYCDAHYSNGQAAQCRTWRESEARRLYTIHADLTAALRAAEADADRLDGMVAAP